MDCHPRKISPYPSLEYLKLFIFPYLSSRHPADFCLLREFSTEACFAICLSADQWLYRHFPFLLHCLVLVGQVTSDSAHARMGEQARSFLFRPQHRTLLIKDNLKAIIFWTGDWLTRLLKLHSPPSIAALSTELESAQDILPLVSNGVAILLEDIANEIDWLTSSRTRSDIFCLVQTPCLGTASISKSGTSIAAEKGPSKLIPLFPWFRPGPRE